MADDMAAIRARIHGVHQLDTVIGAMRGIAAAHAQQCRALLPGVRAYADVVAQAIAQALRLDHAASVTPAHSGTAVRRGRIVFGPEQGFVGGFADTVLAAAQGTPESVALLLIGNRLAMLADAHGVVPAWQCAMATQASGITNLCRRVADALYALLTEQQLGVVEVVFPHWVTGAGMQMERRTLLPLPRPTLARVHGGVPPLVTLPPAQLLDSLAPEYVFAALCEAALHALLAENEARVSAMMRAGSNVDDMLDALRSTERQVRQATITAEVVELASAVRTTGSVRTTGLVRTAEAAADVG